MNYNDYISQFPVELDINKSYYKDNLCYHHIIPLSKQMKDLGISRKDMSSSKFKYDPRCDRRVVLLTPQQHAFAHYLYDRDYNARTATFFICRAHLKFKEVKVWDPRKVYEAFEVLNHTKDSDRIHNFMTDLWNDPEHVARMKKNMSEAKKGRVNVCHNTKWMSNGERLIRVPEDQATQYLLDGWYFSNSKEFKKKS